MSTRNPNPTNYANAPKLGRYELVREIARSNDIVWEARDTRINRRVAVKELNMDRSLSPQGQMDRTERFYREARAAGSLAHPNIVTIHEVSEDAGRHFIAMEYLEGETLRGRINRVGALPLHQVILIGVALCDALEYAHARGIVHRDIKPDNVHILPGFDTANVGAQGVVKLTDFGIARIVAETNLTVAGQVFGTPSYMSPEQIIGQQIDARSDIYSLGVLLHECATGRKPFTGDTIATITYRVMNDPAPPVFGAPPILDETIRHAMAKAPIDRYQTAAALRNALLAALPARTIMGNGMPSPAQNPNGYNAPPLAQRTVQYGTQTQLGVAPGLANPQIEPQQQNGQNSTWGRNPNFNPPTDFNHVPPIYQPEPAPKSNMGKIVGMIALCCLMAGLAVGLGILFKKAYDQSSIQAGNQRETQALNKAITLYQQRDFLHAALLFEKLRSTRTRSDIITKATDGALFSYRELGHDAQNRNDWNEAIRYYKMALTVKPDDPDAKKEYETALKFVQSNQPALPAPEPGAPQRTSDFPKRAAPGTENTSASDFVNKNNAGAQQAQQLLQQGNDAFARGDKDGAIKLWNQAVEVGTGSNAANDAIKRLQETQTSSGF